MKVDANPILNPVKDLADYAADADAPLDLDGARPTHPFLAREVTDIEQSLIRGKRFSLDDLPAFINAVKNIQGPGINDRLFLLEKLLTVMARSPDDSVFAARLQQAAMDILYKDLPHPPAGFLSVLASAPPSAPSLLQGVKYAYRSVDGSNYNVLSPALGKAGTPYARSVPSVNFIPPQYLPDPGLVFDTLLKRDQFVEHPGGVSSLFFAFADLVIHSIFNTNTRDWTVNDASSYLDLSPLYGSSQQQVDAVRRHDGTGRLWEDVFADARLLFMPPAAGALLVLFCRNHNYVAERILAINELGTYASPESLSAQKRAAQDEEIFQRARLVNCAFFMQVILGDYVGAILGLTRDGLGWRLNPLEAMRELTHEWTPLGEGNVVSVEFNLMYRWHATVSQPDTVWTDNLFKDLFEGKPYDQITVDDFRKAVTKYVMGQSQDVKEWTFDKLKRGPDGRYSDADLANILHSATEAPASAFKARGIPEALRIVEVLGILQARSWGTCSLNEFRSFMGLAPYKNFEEWNPDPKVYKAAEALYHDIDNLELHVGLQAEQTKVPMPGAGLCPGYTISRAILADAVCLTRGDRFLTVDLTPFNLTTWGYDDVQYDKRDGSFGGILGKLLSRSLPGYYPAGSAYAAFPFMVPKTMKGYVEKLPEQGLVEKYTWERSMPVRGGPGVQAVIEEKKADALVNGVVPDREVVHKVLYEDAVLEKHAAAFGQIAQGLIKDKSVEHVDSPARYLNVIRDVVNLVPVYWISNDVAGIPMKTETNLKGVFREQELVKMFADVASYLSPGTSTSQEFELRDKSTKVARTVMEVTKGHLSSLSGGSLLGFAAYIVDWVVGHNERDSEFLKTLLAVGKGASADALAAGVFVEIVGSAAPYSRALAEVVDYYLEESRKQELVKLLAAGKAGEAKVEEGIFQVFVSDSTNGVSRGGLLTPDQGLTDPRFFVKTAVQVLRAIFALDELTRVPGAMGKLNRFVDSVDGRKEQLYLDSKGKVTQWPISMMVQYNMRSSA
ncbi:heme peroxidase [Laetiporus sulphureus 93-53]|uniref:Heme peroxidase n=1 Tax=Laetiporus sulphureus 93-53 TaxID=1314785 RepID=A0A165EAJ7_9APHY|nr:heme peroxidase [Laetiporus sulphureus 93-53]KZT06599.1 heme peroxidase [Laetiporus sulphureus 93-53]